jgi:hypothetical protein
MCKINVPSVTLQTAVLMQVKELAAQNKQFSVHDITRAIRTKASDGDLEIPEVEVSGASFRFDIPHAKVKAIFDELWRTGVFDSDFTLSRNFNGTYFEYTPTPVSPVTATTPLGLVQAMANKGLQAAANVALPNNIVPFPTPQPQKLPPPAPSDSVVQGRIQTYLDNCESKGFRPTLKQVQSAIKRDVSTGWSCEKIQDYVEGLGYSIVADPDYVSASQIDW